MACVYITWLLETAYTILKRKQNRKMDKETKHQNLETTNYCPSLPERRRGRERGEEEKEERREGGEEEKEGRKKEVGRDMRQEEETRDGRSREEKMEGWRMYIYILYTHSMTDLHAIVVNSFVF